MPKAIALSAAVAAVTDPRREPGVSDDVLTDLERRMLAFVTGYVSERGNGPTLIEIGDACGVRSVGTVHRYIKSIESKGFLKRVRQGWRPRKPRKAMAEAGRTADDWHREYSRKVHELNKANEEIGRLRNQLEIAKEDIECAHMALDDVGAPRTDGGGNTFSIIGRAPSVACIVIAAGETLVVFRRTDVANFTHMPSGRFSDSALAHAAPLFSFGLCNKKAFHPRFVGCFFTQSILLLSRAKFRVGDFEHFFETPARWGEHRGHCDHGSLRGFLRFRHDRRAIGADLDSVRTEALLFHAGP